MAAADEKSSWKNSRKPYGGDIHPPLPHPVHPRVKSEQQQKKDLSEELLKNLNLNGHAHFRISSTGFKIRTILYTVQQECTA